MTRFKAMSLEEQETSLEQATQEILRAQEGTAASESSEEIGDLRRASSQQWFIMNPHTNQGFPLRSSCTREGCTFISSNPTTNEVDVG
jgi:hypothetical protein